MKTRERIAWIIGGILLISLFFSISLQKWGLGLFGKEVDYVRFGNWSDAITAIATTTAFVTAVIGVLIQHSIRKSDEKRRLIEEETSVYLWLKSKDIYRNEKFIGRTWDLIIQNATKSPIYSWSVKFDSSSEHLDSIQKRPLLPNENIFNLPFLDDVEANKTPTAAIFFEGRSQRFWRRTIKGELKESWSKEIT